MKKIAFLLFTAFFAGNLLAADIPQHISYTKIYDFVDELATDGIIEIHSVVKPYSREFIAQKLLEAKGKEELLNRRQRREVDFYLNDYALELNQLPETKWDIVKNDNLSLAFIQPAVYYRDSIFRLRMTPILGAEFFRNKHGNVANRKVGAEFQGMIGEHLSVFGSLRDVALRGELLSNPQYLNSFPGYEYKESESDGADYSDSRGGIKWAWTWGSVGLVKDNVEWGDNYHGSNILSGRAPSFPMLTLQLKPVRWFQLDYFHGWLVSNVLDSTNYYYDDFKKFYRSFNKFIAANMLTFTPWRGLDLSFGNSIIYAERNVQPAYLIPIAFYKSIDHTLTKGIDSENQNSQVFINISSRNIRHLHLYLSIFADEIKFARFSPSNKETNPISYKLGAKLSNFPFQNLSVLAEYTRSEIISYKHFIPSLTWASNNYNLGHYLGDNSQEIYLALGYKPIRGLDLTLSYLNAKHGNEYAYLKRGVNNENYIKQIIAEPFMRDVVWTNATYSFQALYEIINNVYMGLNVQYSNIRGHEAKSQPVVVGEWRPENGAQGYLDLYTPEFLQGKNLTLNMMFSINF